MRVLGTEISSSTKVNAKCQITERKFMEFFTAICTFGNLYSLNDFSIFPSTFVAFLMGMCEFVMW